MEYANGGIVHYSTGPYLAHGFIGASDCNPETLVNYLDFKGSVPDESDWIGFFVCHVQYTSRWLPHTGISASMHLPVFRSIAWTVVKWYARSVQVVTEQ